MLNGEAIDLEDGALGDDAYLWSSDKDGVLGTGASLPLNTLSPGVHTITLTAKDSNQVEGHASITLTVGVLGNLAYVPPIVDPNASGNVTGIVTLMPGLPTTDIKTNSLVLKIGGQELTPVATEQLGDTDADGLPELAVTFDGAAFRDAIPDGDTLERTVLTGEMIDGTAFSASTQVALVAPGDVNCDGNVDGQDITGALTYLALDDGPSCLFAGDHDCNGEVEIPDVLANLQLQAGFSLDSPQACVVPAAVSAATTGGHSGGLGGILRDGWLAIAALPALVFVGKRRRM